MIEIKQTRNVKSYCKVSLFDKKKYKEKYIEKCHMNGRMLEGSSDHIWHSTAVPLTHVAQTLASYILDCLGHRKMLPKITK